LAISKDLHCSEEVEDPMKSLLCLLAFAINGIGQTTECPPAPASEVPKCCQCPTGIIADASFLYWFGGEEGLSLATNGVLNGGTIYFAENSETVFQPFDYQPGFKLGLGVVIEKSWSLHSEYIWLRGSSTLNQSAPSETVTAGVAAVSAASGTPVWEVADWFLQGTSFAQALAGSAVRSDWRYGLDLLDLVARRPFAQGCWLTIVPSMGLQLAFIRQSLKVSLTEEPAIFGLGLPFSSPSQPIHSYNRSNSWGIGPKVGVECNCLIPKGFRIKGDVFGSLLYTRYTKITHSEDRASTAFNQGPFRANYRNYDCLRPIAKMGLGAGWGRFLRCQQYHVDFLASYDFTLFWEQNMMRKLLDDVLTGTSSNSRDLYFHGLTLTGRLDF